jgi:hypothetical protein
LIYAKMVTKLGDLTVQNFTVFCRERFLLPNIVPIAHSRQLGSEGRFIPPGRDFVAKI